MTSWAMGKGWELLVGKYESGELGKVVADGSQMVKNIMERRMKFDGRRRARGNLAGPLDTKNARRILRDSCRKNDNARVLILKQWKNRRGYYR